MAGGTGFLVLYEELGLAPGISDPDASKQTQRGRGTQLHPDRQALGHADTDRLQRLTRLYGAALAFEQPMAACPPQSCALLLRAGDPSLLAFTIRGVRVVAR
ncbi:MAG: hypothetical protein KGJ46_03090 [Xanthomonadaceae bacterium]|nr:hypothetical protein [Xanthomonadaceae bacterium]MDE2224240.1 hypothetical protein [Xanthomonadaceae bacterium]